MKCLTEMWNFQSSRKPTFVPFAVHDRHIPKLATFVHYNFFFFSFGFVLSLALFHSLHYTIFCIARALDEKFQFTHAFDSLGTSIPFLCHYFSFLKRKKISFLSFSILCIVQVFFTFLLQSLEYVLLLFSRLVSFRHSYFQLKFYCGLSFSYKSVQILYSKCLSCAVQRIICLFASNFATKLKLIHFEIRLECVASVRLSKRSGKQARCERHMWVKERVCARIGKRRNFVWWSHTASAYHTQFSITIVLNVECAVCRPHVQQLIIQLQTQAKQMISMRWYALSIHAIH